jgi:hypothetical protein
MISFDDGAIQIADEELQAVGEAAHAMMFAAQESGVWMTGGGFHTQQASIVHGDGLVEKSAFPEAKAVLGGCSIIEVATDAEALEWARRTAAACRTPQEVRMIMDDPLVEVGGILTRAPCSLLCGAVPN